MKVHESSHLEAPVLVVTDPTPPNPTLTVRPWPDEVIDRMGHDPRSVYVERFWLPLLGPSSVLLLRRLATELEANPEEVALPVQETARSLGLGYRGGRTSSFQRTVDRCRQFHLVQLEGDNDVLLARRKLPPLNRGQVARLPDALIAAHDTWIQAELSISLDGERIKRRARRLALSMFELGDAADDIERQLHRLHFHPVIAREAVAWALARHHEAALAARSAPDPDGGHAA
jgi:hypothetical protein